MEKNKHELELNWKKFLLDKRKVCDTRIQQTLKWCTAEDPSPFDSVYDSRC